MTTRPLLLLVSAASFALLLFSASADDLLDNVLRNDLPAAQPAAMPSPAPALAPAAVPDFSYPASPAFPYAALPPSATDVTVGASSSRTAAKPRGTPKKTFDAQLMDAFAGCCFFIRPKPPEKPALDAGEPQFRREYLP